MTANGGKRDRRVERTRDLLLAAFRDVLFERGYHRVTVRDVIARANVGRSTFYEHFRNKEDLLQQTLAPVLEPFADVITKGHSAAHLDAVLRHMWESRARTRPILLGAARTTVSRFLTDLFEERLRKIAAPAPLLPRAMVAGYLADSQLVLLDAWVTASVPCTAETVARALHAGTNALASALLPKAAA